MIQTRVLMICLLISYGQTYFAQTNQQKLNQTAKKTSEAKTVKDYSSKVIKESAVNLTVEVAENSGKITQLSDRTEVRINAARLLQSVRPDIALRMLETAWNELNETSIGDRFYSFEESQNSILHLAKVIAPDKANKWFEQLKSKQETEQSNNQKKNSTPDDVKRSMADTMVQDALTKIKLQPEQAVTQIIASIQQTNTLSLQIRDAVNPLQESKQTNALRRLHQFLADHLLNQTSTNFDDLDIASSFATLRGDFDLRSRDKIVIFLVNSTKEILIRLRNENQLSDQPKNLDKELSYLQTMFQVFLRPSIENYLPERLPALDEVLQELSALMPASKLESPLFNPNPIEKQIEVAEKIVGSDKRDARLAKIAASLLGSRLLEKKGNLETAQNVISKITDAELKQDLTDFAALARLYLSVQSKDFQMAEKQAESIKKPEWRAWALMALGKSQTTDKSAATELYEKSMQSLEQAWSSPDKSDVALTLAGLQTNDNPMRALDFLAKAVNYANQSQPPEQKKRDADKIYFAVSIADLYFYSSDVFEKPLEDISPMPDLGRLGISNWNEVTLTAGGITNQALRSRLQLILAKAVLNKLDSKNKPAQVRSAAK